MKKNDHNTTGAGVALLALAFLFVMTATEGPYWGEADVEDSIVMIQEQEESESDTLTGMTIVRRQIHSLYKEGQNIPVTTCEETEYVISNGKKVPKTEACKEVYVETKAEEQEEPYKNR